MTTPHIDSENEKLLKDVRTVLSDTEELLATAGNAGGEKAREIYNKLVANVHLAKERLHAVEKKVVVKAKAAAKATDEYVHENPWKSIGIAAGIAFLLGMLVSRR